MTDDGMGWENDEGQVVQASEVQGFRQRMQDEGRENALATEYSTHQKQRRDQFRTRKHQN